MADATLNVAIEANINDFYKNLTKAGNDLDKFSVGVEKDLKQISKSFSTDITKGANQASQSLTDLGRIVQDAPFGFIGIQNNISPLIDSFGRLKAESGSTGGALKTLIGGLAGPAGLGLAIAGVTSAITVLTQNPEILTNFFDSLTGGSTEAAKAQRELNKVFVESVAGVQGEISNIKSLVSIAKDESLSRKERLEAINQLNKQYPELNNQLSLETINSENATKAINGLNKALIVRAKIAAVQELIGEEFKKQLQDQNKSIQGQASALDKLGAVFQAALGPAGIFKANQTLVTSGIEEQNKALKSSNQTISVYEKTLDELNKTLAKTGNLFVDPVDKATKATHGLTKQLVKIKSVGAGTILSEGLSIPDIDTSSLDKIRKKLDETAAYIPERARQFTEDLNQIISTGSFNAFASFGDAIGQAIVTGDNLFEALGQSILGSIGDILVQFGKLTIAAGIASSALASALTNPFNPASGLAAIAAGVALVAIGSAVREFASNPGGNSGGQGKTAPKSIPQFAGGVTGFNGGMALVGEKGPELVTMGRGANVITNDNVNRFMSRGNGDINVVATVGISMGQLVVGLEREKKLMNRTT